MSAESKPAVTMADLGLTPGEAEMFAKGARHLFGDVDPQPPAADEITQKSIAPAPKAKPTGTPAPKPAPSPKPKSPAKGEAALEKITLGGSAKAGKH